MERYAMPQVDRSASTYSPPVQYVPGIAARSPALVRPEINKFGVSSDILTSCDWSAVIHRPAEESEPEDLPSTVDIDAIKEPATPLPPLTPCPPNVDEETEDDDDSSDSESEDGASSSDSDSASQGSGSCRSSSYSDSDSSVSSGKPKGSSSSSSEAREPVPSFSIRETNLDQGGLKLKFSATKSKSNPSQSSSSSDSSSSSSESEEEPKKKLDEGRKSPDVALQRKSVRNVVTPRANARIVKPSVPSPAEPRVRPGVPTRVGSRGNLRPPPPRATSTAKKNPPKPVKKARPLRKSPRAKQKNVAAGGESSSQLSSDEDEDEDDEEGGECGDEIRDLARQLGAEDPDLSISEQLQEINQEDLAAILPDVGGGSFDGFEEENNGTGAGNAQSSSRHQVASPAPSHITSSSSSESDTEQIVSDVISRIQDDSESQTKPLRPSQPCPSRGNAADQASRSEIGYSSNLLAAFVEKTEILSRGGSAASGSSGTRGNETVSSSANNAETSSSKRKRGRPPKNAKGVAASCRNQNQANGMPELEAYMRMDCSQSNVSPDSGIQSVAGSPAGHHSLPGSPRSPPTAQNSGPPILVKHSPCHSPDTVPSPNDKLTKMVSPAKELKLENGGKRGPGRPKHAFVLNTFGKRKRGKRLRRAEIPKKPIVLPPSAIELKVPPYFAGANAVKCNLPALPQISSKRGRGRPKKSPPILEPILPLERHKRDASDSSRKCSSLERVPSSERPTLKRNDSDIKSVHSFSSKGPLKNKEHKHKKRKRHSLDFRRLDPAFLRELTRLSETFEKCCVISPPEIKSKPKIMPVEPVERQRQNQRVSSRRRRREKIRKELMSKSKASSISPKKSNHHEVAPPVPLKVKTPESSPKKERKVDKSPVCVPEKRMEVVEDKKVAKSKKELAVDKKSITEQRHDRKPEQPANQENLEVLSSHKNEHSSKSTRDKEGSAKSKTTVSQTTKDRELPSVIMKEEPVPQKDNRSPPVLREKTKERNRVDSGSQKEKPQPASPQVKDRGEKVSGGKEKSVEQLSLKDLKSVRTPSPVVHKEPHKEKAVPSPIPKEKVPAVPPKDKGQNYQVHVKIDKEKPPAVVPPSKEKQTVALAKEKTPVPALKEKPAPSNKDKIPAPALKEKPTPSNKDKIPAPALKEKPAPSTKDKSVLAPAAKDKKENAPVQPMKEKALMANTSAASPQSAKRRIKKSVVEPPKNKDVPEPTSSSEQRLPLKKRHYHMSASASPNSSPGDSGDKSDESSDSSKEVAESREESDVCPAVQTEHAQDPKNPSVIVTEEIPDENLLGATPKRSCSEPEKKLVQPTKPKEKDVVCVKETAAKRSTPKVVATSVITAVPQSGKRVSSRQAALKQSESQESVKTPPASPLPVKRSQRIKLKHDEVKEDLKVTEVIKKPKEDESSKTDEKDVKKEELKSTKEDLKSIRDVQKPKNKLSKSDKVSDLKKPSDEPVLADELAKVVESGKKNDVDGGKRTTRRMDEAAEQKVKEGLRNDKPKCTVDKTQTSRNAAPISTRSAAKTSLDAIAADLVEVAKTRSKCDKKSLIGVFEPSVKVASEILKLPDPQSDVLSKLKTKLLSPFHEFDVEEELKNIKRPMDAAEILSQSAEKAKKRKMICDVRVHVTKLDPADLLLKGSDISDVVGESKAAELIPKVEEDKSKTLLATIEDSLSLKNKSDDKAAESKDVSHPCDEKLVKVSSVPAKVSGATSLPLSVPVSNHKVKIKRKKINRTGFPVKKKKKKRMDVADGAGHLIPANEPVEQALVGDLVKDAPPQPSESKTKDLPLVHGTPAPDKNDDASEKSLQLDKTELRPASKRIMELKARNEASERRKRKNTPDDASQDEQDASTKDGGVSDSSTDLKSLVGKRLRKTKEDMDDSDADSVKMRKKQPRWRKKYLPAGLFSDYFKEDEPRKPSGNEKVKSTVYNASEHEHGLLPPPAYCSKWVRQRKMPFQLPHDIWWLHTHNQLSGREAVPSWNYKKIRTNVYFDVKPSFSYEAQACNCKPSAEVGCGEECINRMVLAECSPQLCPCKEKCSNQKIQRHEWSPGLARFMTKDKGWGVKTKHKILKDKFILEYVGEVVSDREFKNRMASRYQKDTHHYCLNLDGGLVIDGHRMGGDGRFVNHSCEPNCEMQKWCVNGLFRMALFALREIEPNEELTYDYNFSLFNPSEGQPCKCGSSKCRGVIGGKSQRVALPGASAPVEEKEKTTGQVGRPRKNPGNAAPISHRRKTNSVDKKLPRSNKEQKQANRDVMNASALATVAARLSHMTTLKPLTQQQKDFIKDNRIFLPRNLQRVKRRVEKLKQAVRKGGLLLPDVPSSPASVPGSTASVAVPSSVAGNSNGAGGVPPACVKKEKEGEREVFMTQLNALNCPRSMRTRRLALAEDNPEMTKAARLACLFKDLFAEVTSAKDESGELFSSHFLTLPSKRKFPLYFQRIQKPIDFTTIEQNIVTGEYKTVEAFDEDMNALFKNSIRWYGRTSDLGISATRLRKIYNLAKLEIIPKLEELLGEPPPASFIPAQDDPSGEEEDVIHCICGIFRDEGVMIQCERCLVWQHCYCVGANSNVENYLCERCSPREVDYEIPSQEEASDPSQTNYITLLRGDMQLKQGDTVYVLRDIVNEESTEVPKAKHTYKTIKNWKYSDCDIFKIERLWKDEKGCRFAFGHHYLRPHETFHEPTRKFFPNELMRVPLYEVVPVELVMGQCYVLDLNTYCKGRPIGCDPDHLYVCEYRVDKCARMFAKIPKPKHSNVCTKSYAFETFDVRLKPQRTYAPHGMIKDDKPGTGTTTNTSSSAGPKLNVSRGRGGRTAQHQVDEPAGATLTAAKPPRVTKAKPVVKREDRRDRLNKMTLKILSRLPSKQPPLDLSYLLEPGRRQRKKPPLLAS